MKPLVAYGSTMHGSEKIAKYIASKYGVEALELNRVNVSNLENTNFAIFVIATFGNGSFPQNSQTFAEMLSYSSIDLSQLKFAELALGSSHYQYFCKAGDDLYKMLTDRGAKSIIPYVQSDKCMKDYGESVIEKFKKDIINFDLVQKAFQSASGNISPSNIVPLIGYASTMGNSENIAKQIAKIFNTEAHELNSISMEQLRASKYIIFSVSTFGDGVIADNGLEFVERLSNSDVDLSGHRFSLLALGSTKYPKFCQAGDEVHQLLLNHGAISVLYSKSDKKSGDAGKQVINKFIEDVQTIKIEENNELKQKLIIGFGTTMHGSEKIANEIAGKYGIEAYDLDNITIEQLSKAEVAIFIISTFGEGSYPRNCQKFGAALANSRVDLSSLKFALLGLGSTYYKLFCKAAVNINQLLIQHGAKPIIPFVTSDKSSADQGKSVIQTFISQVSGFRTFLQKSGPIKPIIAYGSTRHNAERVAKQIAEKLNTNAVEINSLNYQQLEEAKICIFVISTINDGEFPKNASTFCQKLCSDDSNVDLRNLQYALLGLGSRYYGKFCKASEDLNQALQNKGAKLLIPYQKSDKASEDQGESVIRQFVSDVILAVGSTPNDSFNEPIVELKELDETANGFLVHPGFTISTIKQKTLMSAPDYEPQFWHYVIDSPGLKYNCGDYCLIMPQNDPEVVSSVISKLNLNPNTVYEIKSSQSLMLPSKASVLQLFTQIIDLNAKPKSELYTLFGSSIQKPEITVADLILRSEITEIPNLSNILLYTTQIEPRTYSIASERENELDLIVKHHTFQENYYGLCTHYLNLASTESIQIQHSMGAFHYPTVNQTPIILIGLGSGIAPFFSILEHRRRLIDQNPDMKIGDCILFIGLRYNRSAHAIIQWLKEIEQNAKVLTKLYIAISREDKHQHVQDIMKDEAQDDLWSIWENEKAELFFCGPPDSAVNDIREIMQKLTSVKTQCTRTEAVSFCAKRKMNVEQF